MTAREELARLRWRARRGMRELDELLLAYLDRCGDSMGDLRRAQLTSLLSATDPELCDWLLHGVSPLDPDLADVIHDIRCATRP